ncbi:hypothetical protein N9C15_01490 [Schleiferiaceae bacterium]|nr:hypothetical protein [Schleiferiaceae bacterium]MDA8565062.1 hypothetical protein [Schleiferiaceae bacterium]MDA8816785.1 hypothetical protein [Schleiferiaceae bacterium]MDA9792305.1 hypothetical protein [Schleiferiaceae bacterium]MDC6481223.1 hypothetical protein [Schleiferiaceae bacterium]|tara:strand:- start:166 stop:1431 length:1266 start_codon:yes stop_codon:yes gene_type:complete
MKNHIFGFCLLIMMFFSTVLNGQDWEKRHAFAKSYFGAGAYYMPTLNSGTILDVNGNLQSFEKAAFMTPAINIGATHFWGHADFYVSITTSDISLGENAIENKYSLGTFTGLRFYPYPTEVGKVRPYVGYAFSPYRYEQVNSSGEVFKHTAVKSMYNAGLAYQLPSAYITLEYGRTANPSFETYLSRTTTGSDVFPVSMLQLGINFSIETTSPAASPMSKKWNEVFAVSNANGLFLAAGPSSVFPIRSSSYVTDYRPYLDDMSMPIIFPDFAAGYHFTKSDIILAAASRRTIQKRSAFNYTSRLQRQSLSIEGYKFLVDYHGFVPFLGAGIGRENLELTRTEFGSDLDPITEQVWSPNIVFGWDIRPSIKGDWWILRTNLRYYPALQLDLAEGALSQQHIEFNFIQLVVYPQRLQKMMNGL